MYSPSSRFKPGSISSVDYKRKYFEERWRPNYIWFTCWKPNYTKTHWLLLYGEKTFHKISSFMFYRRKKSYRFGMTWRWWANYRFVFFMSFWELNFENFEWTIPWSFNQSKQTLQQVTGNQNSLYDKFKVHWNHPNIHECFILYCQRIIFRYCSTLVYSVQ